MLIETNKAILKTAFSHAQIEITGACNMNCDHCRACDEKPIFMGEDTLRLILDFAAANRGGNFNLTVSGGEPLMHPRFAEIMELIRTYPFGEIVVTTNGSLITEELLARLNDLAFPDLTVQVSLDSVEAAVHDANRRYDGAFDRAVEALGRMKDYPNIRSSVRMTVTRETIGQVDDMVRLLAGLGVSRLGVGSVIPAGRGAAGDKVLRPEEKQAFLTHLAELHRQWAGTIEIVTEDPLKCLVPNNPWIHKRFYEMESNPAVFGGCTAGIDCFNVNTLYQITPCSVFPEAIVEDIRQYTSVEELTRAYETSNLVRQLCERNLEGACGNCRHKQICGGCRATAHYFGGSYFSSDGTCWKGGGEQDGE